MNEKKSYILTILVNPQAESGERNEIESLVKSWIEKQDGKVNDVVRDDKKRMAYVIDHTQQAVLIKFFFEVDGSNIADLQGKLKRQKRVLRFRLFKKEPRKPDEKTLKDIPAKSAQIEKVEAQPSQSSQKAPIEKLDEKIEEILEEEVL